MRILIVENKGNLNKLGKKLSKNGYKVEEIEREQNAFDSIVLNHTKYKLIILDIELLHEDSFLIIKNMRDLGVTCPILALNAEDEIKQKIDLLLSGADDYLVKNFSFEELCVKVKGIFGRLQRRLGTIWRMGDLKLDPVSKKASKSGKEIPLTSKEFALLEHFVRNPNKVISREELLSRIQNSGQGAMSNVVDAHVKNIRKKLDPKGFGVLQTVRGVGYLFRKQILIQPA